MKDAAPDKRGTSCPLPPEGIGHFAERLRFLIGERSVRSFERESGVSEGTLRKYLSGERTPTLDRLALLAAAGGVPPEWLATGRAVIGPAGIQPGPELGTHADLLAAAMVAVERAVTATGRDPGYERQRQVGRAMHDLVTILSAANMAAATALTPHDLKGLARLFLNTLESGE
ncbi:MAG: helix-turn-helix transcriptional regulator [Nitrospirae bacterium]|nr:helix-turn-helix transcriptional regulator [Nitrospirota bacterium]